MVQAAITGPKLVGTVAVDDVLNRRRKAGAGLSCPARRSNNDNNDNDDNNDNNDDNDNNTVRTGPKLAGD